MEKETTLVKQASVRITPRARRLVEAFIFGSNEPITAKEITDIVKAVNETLEETKRIEVDTKKIDAVVTSLNEEYANTGRAYQIIKIAGGYAYATLKEYAPFLGKLYKEKAKRKLSVTAIETLAIIAYKQPITKTEIEFIRGVNADYIMKTLLEKELITILGRAQTPGRPLLYGTTIGFLKQFGLNDINDLPKPREIEELLQETEKEVEKRMLLEQQEMDLKPVIKREPFDPNSKAPHIPRKKSALQLPERDPQELKPLERIKQSEIIEEKIESKVITEKLVTSKKIKSEKSAGENLITIKNIPTNKIELDQNEADIETPTPVNAPESQKGWKKWTQKIRGFFQKLFE